MDFRRSLPFFLFSLGLISGYPSFLQAKVSQAAMELLQDAEVSRGVIPSTGLEWKVEARSESAAERKDAVLLVRSQYGRSLAEILSPETSRGKKYLLADGTMFFYRPGTQRPIIVPARQQVAGDAAIGDIASTSFLLEYAPTSVKPGLYEEERCAVFQMNAKAGSASSYSYLLLWVSEDARVYRKAEFYTKLGRHIRTARFVYDKEITLSEKTYPFLSKLEVTQLLGTAKTTTQTFSDHQLAPFPPEIFQRDTMADPNAKPSLVPKLLRPGGE
ncbi:MAG: outer membrane lipoprotein-sorting protein [Verrucomicrobiota bacterium]